MECRKEAKAKYNSGALPGFDPTTRKIRVGDWVCAAPPPAVADRRVEITGPTERKMVIYALNSGAKVFMVSWFNELERDWRLMLHCRRQESSLEHMLKKETLVKKSRMAVLILLMLRIYRDRERNVDEDLLWLKKQDVLRKQKI